MASSVAKTALRTEAHPFTPIPRGLRLGAGNQDEKAPTETAFTYRMQVVQLAKL